MHAIALAGPAVEPVPLDEMKAYLRLDQSDEDDIVAALVVAARSAVETASRLAFVSQTWRVSLDRLPRSGLVRLPLAPILSIDAVRLATQDGTSEVSVDRYSVELGADPAELTLSAGAVGPTATVRGLAIDLRAGFGPAPADVPQPLRLAIRRLAARWYAERGDGARATAGPLDPDIAALVAPFARPRLA